MIWPRSSYPNFFFFLATQHSMRILVPRPGFEPVPPAVEGRSLNNWTTREFPRLIKTLFPTFFTHLAWCLGCTLCVPNITSLLKLCPPPPIQLQSLSLDEVFLDFSRPCELLLLNSCYTNSKSISALDWTCTFILLPYETISLGSSELNKPWGSVISCQVGIQAVFSPCSFQPFATASLTFPITNLS